MLDDVVALMGAVATLLDEVDTREVLTERGDVA